jgi:hypothetical protein
MPPAKAVVTTSWSRSQPARLSHARIYRPCPRPRYRPRPRESEGRRGRLRAILIPRCAFRHDRTLPGIRPVGFCRTLYDANRRLSGTDQVSSREGGSERSAASGRRRSGAATDAGVRRAASPRRRRGRMRISLEEHSQQDIKAAKWSSPGLSRCRKQREERSRATRNVTSNQ